MQALINLILSLFSSKSTAQPTPAPQEPPKTPIKDIKVEINWTDPKAKVSKYFTVKEVLYLPNWNTYHVPSEEEKANIIKMAEVMDKVREFINKPIKVHCWIRPNKANCPGFDPFIIKLDPKAKDYITKKTALAVLDYNSFIGSTAKRSPHIFGKAVDWSCGEDCNITRQKLMSKLEEFNMCMEDIPGQWIHLDIYEPAIHGGKRFFKP